VGDGYLKKISALLIMFLFFSINMFAFSSFSVNGGISLWPGKLTIDISEYPESGVRYNKICITNPYDYDVIVTSEILNPPYDDIDAGYSNIPDLSWIEISPDDLTVPANSQSCYSLGIIIPEDKKSLHDNEKWEVWVRFFKKPGAQTGIVFNIKLATKIFIHTPESSEQRAPNDDPLIFLLIFVGLLIFVVAYLFFRRRVFAGSDKRAVYYVKKRKR
jgi:hypothetical protein